MKDTWGRNIDYLRLSITDRCNLRCQYCMPETGIDKVEHTDILTFEEFLTLSKAFVELGVRKIRITGGEPTVRLGVVDFVRELKATGVSDLAMTTNGILLPHMAAPLKEAGLDRINISLDTLDAQKYEKLTRGGELDRVLEGIQEAIRVGLTPVKINAVLMKGINDDEIEALCALTKDAPVHVRFIELMPIGEARGQNDLFVPLTTVLETLPELVPIAKEEAASVASRYQLPGAQGTVGLIRPMSDHFCGACNRVRLHANGNVQMCLHDSTVFSLRDVLRNGGDIKAEIQRIVWQKPQKHHLLEGQHVPKNMSEIGG